MTRHQKFLIYACGILAGYLLTWPIGLIVLFFFADMDGKFPVRENE